MQDLQQGTELASRYTLVRKLGSGGAAETWLATDRLTRAAVALKVLVSDRVPVATFHKEWQTSIRLMHAHIGRVFEYSDDAEAPFYSLQYIDGPDIGVLSGAPLEDIFGPVALIADALRYAHGKGVVHRDIKASNVLLDHNGAPYLIDFGVAAVAGAAATGGSVIAASPESLAGNVPHSADDIFALGGLIYELVSGTSPYSSSATAEDIRDKIPPPLRRPDGALVPTAIAELVAAMLAKDAVARPEAQEVVAALEAAGFAAGPAPAHYVEGAAAGGDEIIELTEGVHRPVRAAPAAAVGEAAVDKGISPRTLGISLAVLIALLIGVVFFLPQPEPTAREDAADTAETSEAGDAAAGTERAPPQRDARVVARADTDAVLGQLLSKMDTLENRAVQRWGGLRFSQAQAVYAEGDEAYLARDYATASEKYAEAIDLLDPLLDEVEQVFENTLSEARAALDNADSIEAVRLFELAVAISPNHAGARAGYARARNLDTVMSLTDQGLRYETDLELEAARQSFAQAVELDPEWQPAQDGLARVLETIRQMEFDQRMTEGLMSLAEGDFAGARAAFRMAQEIKPGSREPADGLQQVDQGIRLERIATLERTAAEQESSEAWESATETYQSILEIDADLAFAQDGLQRAQNMTALHEQLDEFIAEPDTLSAPSTMARATRLVVDITRMPNIGPRLAGQRDELSRLLKRAATPLTVTLVSDNLTNVSIYKVGKLGSFETHELQLRPGTYVAVGSRPGYRDVRLEFRVAPEIDLQPVVVRCEEAI
ncbi:MAG: protein kinase [Woeseiaceae bacterium]|nr:protein kinase [Woeseiaceae bacterium]NIP21059.1 protein kinase [Woeseiaceae bacterium]NIS90031.1 protein kinase [Woeseiaceae bacterium]